MGTCFGKLSKSKKKNKRLYRLEHSRYSKSNDRVELHFLVEDEEVQQEAVINENASTPNGLFSRIISLFKTNPYQNAGGGHHRLLEVEAGGWEEESVVPQDVNSGTVAQTEIEEVQLVTLDVRSLCNVQPSWSNLTPPSSVDLEWENDSAVDSIPAVCRRRLLSMTEECSTGSMMEGSPAESLEWDSCDQLALDTDTEQLLCEIEHLTARALRETGGDWANR